MSKMHKNLFVTFLIFLSLILPLTTAFAQVEEKTVLSADDLNKHGALRFFHHWKYHPGDNPDWAKPEFDDSEWEQMEGVTFPYDNWQGIGWFRFDFEVDSTLCDVPLGLTMEYRGAVEFYLDGKLLYRYSKVGASKEEEEPSMDMIPAPLFISFRTSRDNGSGKSLHVVAIRFSNFFMEPGSRAFGFYFDIGDLNQKSAQRDNIRRRLTIHQMLLMGVFLAFALLHFLFFLYYPNERANLYFAVLTTSVALTVYFWFQFMFITDPVHFGLVLRFRNTVLTLAMLSAIRLTYLLIYPEQPRIFLYFVFVGLILTLWSWFRPFVAGTYLIVFYIAVFMEIIRSLISAWIKKRGVQLEGSWIILLGLIPLSLTAVYWFLVALKVVPEPWTFEYFPTPFYAMLILMLSMSVFLARNFSQTHKDLEAQSTELAFQVGEKTRTAEALQNALSQVEQLKDRLQAENVYLQDEIKLQHNFGEIICSSELMKSLLRKVEQVAATDTTVLILGETGTGKELIARAVHNISVRRGRPLVKVNCAVLPANLIESELFGHEKGAFTGAHFCKVGRFELADGATIFLDEIGNLPLELQTKLLRVLQEGEIERLGSTRTIDIDVRVITATNRDLEKEIHDGGFREDLYYRLNVFPIKCPPLRERNEDIPLLVNHFIKKYSAKSGKAIKTITQTAIDRL
ncbi:MAG: sigma 54-interacting transcriptional regulator, partial [bacterium]